MPDQLDVLIDNATITRRVAELARAIEEDHSDVTVVLIGILKGSFHFLSDLSRHLRIDSEVDFLQASSYGNSRESSGVVQIRKDIDIDITGRHVVLVEDIVDTGTTINHLRDLFAVRAPASIRVAALLSKPSAHRVETLIDYVGFEIPNVFVVGYGLDDAERFRNLPYIAVVRNSERSESSA
ncbi:MAG: hypoxanthine phosphoribosyltransferase [Fimbriimonadaceae bacterium]|nr:hypoxanthine phosphoribosyltransferase [Fimbriimonadaceae bacterium]